MQNNLHKINFSLEYNLAHAADEVAEEHSENARKMEEYIEKNPIAIELIEQIFWTFKFEQMMVAKFEAQLAEIWQALTEPSEETKEEAADGKSEWHKEAKAFDKLSLEDKIALVTFNSRMS